jgi:hypothetical protein
MYKVFDKAQALAADARQRFPVGQLINYLMVDAARIADTNLVPTFHWGTWCSVLILATGLYALYAMLGNAVFAGLGVILVSWPVGSVIVGRIKVIGAAPPPRTGPPQPSWFRWGCWPTLRAGRPRWPASVYKGSGTPGPSLPSAPWAP